MSDEGCGLLVVVVAGAFLLVAVGALLHIGWNLI